MKKGQKLWTRDELILAINLYCKTPFGKLHSKNPEVVKLAELIDRSPNSVAYKLVNFASLDPSLKAKGIVGAVNASRLDRETWDEFYNNWDSLPFKSEKLRAMLQNSTIETLNEISERELPSMGREREQVIKARVNQSFFRKSVLAAYNNTCCITGLNHPDFLVAGHIKPWAVDEKNRLNPRNGISINPLHDKAFENGYITITPDYVVKVSTILSRILKDETHLKFFMKHDEAPIILPKRFLPDTEFLKYHNEMKFKG